MVWVHSEGGEDTSCAMARVWDMVRCTCHRDCLGYLVEKRGRKEREQLRAVAAFLERCGGALDEVGGSDFGETSTTLRDIWEVESARLSPETSLAKVIFFFFYH